MNRTKKEMIVGLLNQEVNSAKSIILLDYKGINVESIEQFRKYCRTNNVSFRVVKNTLFQLAIKNTAFSCLDEYIDGPVSILYSKEDPIAPAKAISNFDKKLNKFTIKAGSLDGRIISSEKIEKLSKLPSKEVLLAQLMGVLNGPSRSFVSVLNQTVSGFVNILNNIKNKKEEK